jgi:hypothetical protein
MITASRHPLGYREVCELRTDAQGVVQVISWRMINVHEQALDRAWRRLQAGRPIPAAAIRALVQALVAIDADKEAAGELVARPWINRGRVVLLRHSVGDATYAELAQAMHRMAEHSAKSERTIAALNKEQAAHNARRAGVLKLQAQGVQDTRAIEALLRDPSALTRLDFRRNVFRRSLSSAATELRDAVFTDRSAEPASARLFREDFPVGLTRLKELILSLPADLQPGKK